MADGAGTILIIDDEEALRYILATWLQDAGFQVRQASNCQQAQPCRPGHRPGHLRHRHARRQRSRTCQDLKSQRRGRSLPILLLSGYYTTAEDRARP